MKISPQWVREFVDLKIDNRQLAEQLTLHGISVEGIDYPQASTGPAGGPGSPPQQAKIGLAGGPGSHEGDDMVYEVEFTSNRPDAMNHYGVARECAAIFDVDLKPVTPKLPALAMAARAGADFDPRPEKRSGERNRFAIEIADPTGCARYTARIVRDVKIGPSPESIARRLQSVDQRSISNVADATNFVMWEMGQPTHAFDLDLLEGSKIIVRRARPGETLRTLDGVERQLAKEDLVIADARKPVALAGVMGGADTAISERTHNVLIEAAWFDPASIRRTAKRHGMHTDASHRFERGADSGATSIAAARVAQLTLESAGGRLDGPEIDAVARVVERPTLALRRSEVRRILGKDISAVEIERILRRLGFVVTPGRLGSPASKNAGRSTRPARAPRLAREDAGYGSPLVQDDTSLGLNPPMSGGAWPQQADSGPAGVPAPAAAVEESASFSVQVPTWRLDVEREIDLIEEIARIHGFDNFENTLPEFAGAIVELSDEHKDAKLRNTLLALGYNEAITLTFTSPADARAFTSGQVLALANPISAEAAVLRTSLVPGMLQMLAYNLNRGTNDARLFEAGHVFERVGDRADERKRLALGATGNAQLADWETRPRAYSFFDMKGDIEQLLGSFAQRSLYFDEHAAEFFHPGRSARAVMDGATVARFGQLHPEIANLYPNLSAELRKLRQPVYVGEIYLDRLYQHELRPVRYQPVPRYPAVGRDFSFGFADAVSFERILSAVHALGIAELRCFQPVEIFRGGTVPAGKYSVLLRVEFQSAERTLRDEEVTIWAQQIVKQLQALGGVLRA